MSKYLKYNMKFKIFYENKESTMGGFEIVSFSKLIWWLFLGRIDPKEKSTIYYIRKIETIKGKRV